MYIARRGVCHAGQLVEREVIIPDQIAAIARQILVPLPAFGAAGHHRVVDEVNIAVGVGINKIEAGNVLQRDRVTPFFKGGGGAHGQPLFDLANFVHARVTYSVGAMVGFHDRTMDGAITLLFHCPR